MIHKDKGLIVYVDCQPSEQFADNENETACLIGLYCLKPEAFKRFKQYKDTPAVDRPCIAEEIANKILSENDIKCVGSIGDYSSIKSVGEKYLSNVIGNLKKNTIGKYKEKGYKVYGRNLNYKTADFIPWYVMTLVFMTYNFALIAKQLKQNKLTFSLDRIPGDSKTAMQFMEIMGHYPSIFKYMKKIEEEFGIELEFANMVSYVDSNGVRQEANSHPGMVLIDWIVHSVYSAMNNLANIDTGTRDEEYRESIIRPYQILKERNLIHLESIEGIVFTNENDPDYTDELKEIVASTNFVKAL